MTYDEIGKALGLLPSELWEGVAIGENVKKMRGCADLWERGAKDAARTRGTGRTTVMMVGALQAMSEGRAVVVCAYDAAWESKIVRQIKVWAEKLKLDPKLVRGQKRSTSPVGSDGAKMFVDHYLGPPGMGRWEATHG